MGLFSGGTNPYASNLTDSLGRVQGVAGQFGGLADDADDEYQNLDGEYGQALQDKITSLQRDPYTDAYSTSRITGATAGTTATYARAKASLQAEMDKRGISGSGNEIGGTAALDLGQAGQISNAANGVAMDAVTQRRSDSDQILSLLGGAKQSALGTFTSSLGSEGGLNEYQSGQYDNLSNQWEQRQQAQQDQLMQLLGGIGAAGVTAYGKKAMLAAG